MEPVEIDITMRQNVSDEAPRAVDEINKLSAASQHAQEDLNETIAFQKRIISDLEKQLAPLEANFKKLNVATSDPATFAARQKASSAFKELKTELEGEKQALVELEKQNASYGKKLQTVESQMRSVREEMGRLKLAGKDEGVEYQSLREKLSLLGTAYKAMYAEQQQLSRGGAQFAGIAAGVSALSGAMAAGAGAMGLVSAESEKYAAIQTKVQSLLAITIGLEQISQTLHKTSPFYISTLTKAKELWASANLKLASSLGLTNIAAKALLVTITGGLIFAVTLAIGAISNLIEKYSQASAAQRKLGESIAQEAASSIVQFEALRKSYIALGNDIDAKNKIIAESKKLFDVFGLSITNINEADSLFISRSDDFKNALLERAHAAGAMEIATEKIRAYYSKLFEADARETSPNISDWAKATPGAPGGFAERGFAAAKRAAQKMREDAQQELSTAEKLIQKSIDAGQKAEKLLEKAGLSSSKKILEGTKEYWINQKNIAEETLARLKDVDIGSTIWNKAVEQYNLATEKLKGWDLSSKIDSSKIDKIEKAKEKLKRISVDMENEINAAGAAAVEEGARQRLEQLKAKYDKQISFIEKREREIEELEKITGAKASKERSQLVVLKGAYEQQYDNAAERIKYEAKEVVEQMWADVNSTFQSELDKNLSSIEQYYEAQLKIAKKNILDPTELAAAEAGLLSRRKQEETIIRQRFALKELDIEERTALHRNEIRNKEVLFESTRQQNMLIMQQEYAKKRLDMLIALKEAGEKDLDDEIAELKELIESLGYSIDNLNVSKFMEMQLYVTKLFGALSKIGGKAGEIISSLGNSVEGLSLTLQKSASKRDKISAGIAALGDIIELVARQISQNKIAQQEWRDAIVESKQEMALLAIETNKYSQSNLFGVENPYSRAIAGAKQYSEALLYIKQAATELEGGKAQVGTKKVVSGSNVVGGFGSGAVAGATIGGLASSWSGPFALIGAAVGALVGGVVGLIARKTVPVFEDLKKRYGEIYDPETFELNPRILEDYKKLDDSTKKLVDNWKQIKEKALEAQEQMRQNFSDLAGDIGDKLSDALVGAFRDGDIYAGIDDFQNYMNSTIEQIISQLIFAAHFQDLFKELEKRFNDSFKSSGDQDIVDDLIWFSKQYKEGVSRFGESLEAAQEEMRKQGVDIFASQRQREGATRGLSAASQESISELVGGVYSLRLTLSEIRIDGRERLITMRMMRDMLLRVADNSDYLKYLPVLRDMIDEIRISGVKLKE